MIELPGDVSDASLFSTETDRDTSGDYSPAGRVVEGQGSHISS